MGDYHIRMQLDIGADAGTVRRALDSEQGIGSWWSNRTGLSDHGPDGRRLRVSFPDMPQPFEFAVRDGAGAPIEWVTGGFPPWWAGTTVRLEIGPNPEGPGTRMQFQHRDYDPEDPVIPIVTLAWAQILLRLKAYAETGTCQPFFDF